MTLHNLVCTKHVLCMPNVLFGTFPICYHPCRLIQQNIACTIFDSLPWTKDREDLRKPIRNYFCSILTRFCYHKILLCLKGLRKECKNLVEMESLYQNFNIVNRSIELYLNTFSVHQARFLSSCGCNVSRKISCTAFWPADTIIDVIHQPSTFSGIIFIFSILISLDGIVHMLLEVMIHS